MVCSNARTPKRQKSKRRSCACGDFSPFHLTAPSVTASAIRSFCILAAPARSSGGSFCRPRNPGFHSPQILAMAEVGDLDTRWNSRGLKSRILGRAGFSGPQNLGFYRSLNPARSKVRDSEPRRNSRASEARILRRGSLSAPQNPGFYPSLTPARLKILDLGACQNSRASMSAIFTVVLECGCNYLSQPHLALLMRVVWNASLPIRTLRPACSADWQSVISPGGNRRDSRFVSDPLRRNTVSRLPIGDTAGCKHALRRLRQALQLSGFTF